MASGTGAVNSVLWMRVDPDVSHQPDIQATPDGAQQRIHVRGNTTFRARFRLMRRS